MRLAAPAKALVAIKELQNEHQSDQLQSTALDVDDLQDAGPGQMAIMVIKTLNAAKVTSAWLHQTFLASKSHFSISEVTIVYSLSSMPPCGVCHIGAKLLHNSVAQGTFPDCQQSAADLLP